MLVVKKPHANVGDTRDMGSVPGWGRSSGGGNDNPLNTLVWKIPWAEEPGGLWIMGHKELTPLMTHMHMIVILIK